VSLDDLAGRFRVRPHDGLVNLAGYDSAAHPGVDSLDCSGKNGTIKHVAIAMNPAGVRTASFGVPSEEEQNEHFLDRYRRELPRAGELGVFARSHFEDVLVPMALRTEEPDTISDRIDQINEFERGLGPDFDLDDLRTRLAPPN